MVGSHNSKSSTNGGGSGSGGSSGGGLRHALPEKSQHNGLLVSRIANRSEYGESSHHRTSEIGESYALLSNVEYIMEDTMLFAATHSIE